MVGVRSNLLIKGRYCYILEVGIYGLTLRAVPEWKGLVILIIQMDR